MENAVTLPPGRYLIIDPCYAIQTSKWNEVSDVILLGDTNDVKTYNGHQFIAYSTEYGDGVYEDEQGNSYDVDSGMIGAIPEAMVTDGVGILLGEMQEGRWITSETGLVCSKDGAVLNFGGITINTDPPDEEWYDGQYDDESDWLHEKD